MNVVAVIDRVSPEAEGRLRLLGWPLAATPSPGQGAVMVRERLTEEDLAAALAEPWVGALELDVAGAHAVGACFRRHLAEGGVGLSLRSDTTYSSEAAPLFARTVLIRLLNAESDDFGLEFVVQEMVANAVLHGNLQVGGVDAQGADGLITFAGRIEAALAQSALASRRVQISASLVGDRLELAVEDDGDGFDQTTPHPNSRRPHGLSLLESMVNDLRIEEGGRRTVAVFLVPSRSLPPLPLGLDEVRVLVVDDNKLNRVLMEALLVNMGVGRVETVDSGEAALAAVERNCPDLIMLDVMMPGIDGFEVCRRLRRRYPLTDLPVIFVTALDGPSDRAACFLAGGSDMVTKPIEANEVAARVGVHLRLGQAMRRLKAYQDRVNEELFAARGAQAALSPSSAELAAVRRRTGLLVEGRIESSFDLGGDFWTVLPAGPNRLMLLVADFTGHGLSAAFNVFRLHLLLSRLPRRMPGPAELLNHLNVELKAVLRPGQFAAALAALIDLEEGVLTYAGGASPPPLILHGGEARLLKVEGAPLGAFLDAEYEEHRVDFPAGAALLAYSDALIESEDAGGTPICDEETLQHWVLAAEEGHSLAEEVLARFREKLPGLPPDDLTLVTVRRPAIEGQT